MILENSEKSRAFGAIFLARLVPENWKKIRFRKVPQGNLFKSSQKHVGKPEKHSRTMAKCCQFYL